MLPASMTSIGHTLTGLTLAVAGMPTGLRRPHRPLLLALCGTAANAPDLPLPGWGHSMYHVSHSLFVNAGLLVLLAVWAAAWPHARREVASGWRGFGLIAAAWLSHMLLDSLYDHGRGIAIFWPFSDAHLALPVSWFSTLRPPLRSAHNLQVFGIELLFYGAIFLAVLLARRVGVGGRTSSNSGTLP